MCTFGEAVRWIVRIAKLRCFPEWAICDKGRFAPALATHKIKIYGLISATAAIAERPGALRSGHE
jgi:hypothetical protein